MTSESFDLVLRGGEVLDLEGRRRYAADVGIASGRIVAVSADLAVGNATVLDVSGALVGPGWVDTHTHVFNLFKESCLDADSIGVEQGVVAVVDAGSFGAANAAAFEEYVVKRARTKVFGLMHVSRLGNMHQPGESEILSWLNIDDAVSAIDRHRTWVRGMKVRASASAVGALGILPVVLAKKAASEAGVPLMAHVGNAPPTLDAVCDLFAEGDVISHCFHGKVGGVITRVGLVLPAIRNAVERGVRLDVGHGSGSFSFGVAERALAAGLKPHHISTDLHRGNVRGPVYSLALTLSKLLDLGMDLFEVIAAGSLSPARTFAIDEIGPVTAGRPANLTVFRLVNRPLTVRDSYRGERTLDRILEPAYAIIDGVPYPARAEMCAPAAER
ncbi:MAG: amidohydrolase/deacetylase family metallohydrolase [Dehalococcoidia bacterium]